jgi:hypothetical protein
MAMPRVSAPASAAGVARTIPEPLSPVASTTGGRSDCGEGCGGAGDSVPAALGDASAKDASADGQDGGEDSCALPAPAGTTAPAMAAEQVSAQANATKECG